VFPIDRVVGFASFARIEVALVVDSADLAAATADLVSVDVVIELDAVVDTASLIVVAEPVVVGNASADSVRFVPSES
jgi:hypothetical protein